MRRTSGFLTVGVLLATLAGCGGSDAPAGTLSEDELPSGAKVAKVTHDEQAGQVQCQDVNDVEDNDVMTPSPNYDQDRRAVVSYQLEGKGREYVGSSVWRLARPQEAVARVGAGLDACVKAYPEVYQRFEVSGHPDAVGYTAKEGKPTPEYTRRILVPLSDRVVIVSSSRSGDDDFVVRPDAVLKKAIAASRDAPTA